MFLHLCKEVFLPNMLFLQVAQDTEAGYVVDNSRVELIDLTDPNSCIRSLNTVQGALVVYDDGSITENDLAALSNIRSIMGAFYLYGAANSTGSKITTLKGLENLQVGDERHRLKIMSQGPF